MIRWIVIGFLSVLILFLFGSLGVTNDKLQKLQTQIITLEKDIASIASELTSTKSELATVTQELSLAKLENEKLRSGDKYRLRDPYYKEVMDFLAADLTTTKQYIKGEYEVTHFARDVIHSAKEKGLRCALVAVIISTGSNTWLVGFQTNDTGLVYVNPIDDKVMKVVKGGKLFRDSGYTVNFDDTIVEILIYW